MCGCVCGSLISTIVRELFYIIANPFRSETIQDMPEFRKPVQKVRTFLKVVHMASVIAKETIRVLGKFLFGSTTMTASCMSILWQCLLPCDDSFEGDAQMRAMHDSLRVAHFCDVLELLRMYHREPLIVFLRDAQLQLTPQLRVRPVPLLCVATSLCFP
jgi:hypothetical protein